MRYNFCFQVEIELTNRWNTLEIVLLSLGASKHSSASKCGPAKVLTYIPGITIVSTLKISYFSWKRCYKKKVKGQTRFLHKRNYMYYHVFVFPGLHDGKKWGLGIWPT